MFERLTIYLWHSFLVLGVTALSVSASSAWSPPEECTGSIEYWEDLNKQREADIQNRRKNLRESRDAHTDRIQPNNVASTRLGAYTDPMMRTLANPDFPSMTRAQQRALMDANMALDMQAQIDPWRTPHRPGANSLLDNQRFNREIPQIRSQIAATERYIKRCFTPAYYEASSFGSVTIAWTCTGLEGPWSFEVEQTILPAVEGRGSFTFPPEPAGGRWLSKPFSYSLSGERVEGDCLIIDTIEISDQVMEIERLGPYIGISVVERGDAQTTVRSFCPPPEGDLELSFPGGAALFNAGQLVMEKHSRCP